MRSSAWLVLMIFVLWCIGSWYWYINKVKRLGTEPVAVEVEEGEPWEKFVGKLPAEYLGPIMFNWASPEPLVSDRFLTYKDSILGLLGPEDTLKLQGYYYVGEKYSSKDRSLGMARVQALGSVFALDLDESRIQYDDLRMPRPSNKLKTVPFPALELKVLSKKEAVVDTSSAEVLDSMNLAINDTVLSVDTVATITEPEVVETDEPKMLEELDGKTIVRFKYNSTNQTFDPEVKAYLDELTIALIETDKRIKIVGFSDATGPEKGNYRLAKWRAASVRDVLIARGAPPNKITIESKGEKDPVATNKTAKGRAQNRRAEIYIY